MTPKSLIPGFALQDATLRMASIIGHGPLQDALRECGYNHIDTFKSSGLFESVEIEEWHSEEGVIYLKVWNGVGSCMVLYPLMLENLPAEILSLICPTE